MPSLANSQHLFFVIPSVAEGSLHALRLVEMTEGGVAKYAKSVSKLAKNCFFCLKVRLFKKIHLSLQKIMLAFTFIIHKLKQNL